MKILRFVVGASVLAVSSAACAQAQQAPAASTARAADQPVAEQATSGGLADIVVTAQRRTERVHDVPLTISAVSSSTLAAAGVTNFGDLAKVVSGVNFGGVGNWPLPSIRGVSTGVTTNGGENPNSLYVDGVYYSLPHILGGALPDVERIEVLKGPQGTLFGRNSVGGAIRLFTRDPTFEPSANFTLEAGAYTGSGTSRSAPHIMAKGFLSAPIVKDVLAASISAGYDYTSGYLTDDATGGRFGLIRRANVRGKLLFEPSDAFKLVLSGFYLKNNDDGLLVATPINVQSSASVYPGSIIPTKPYHVAYDTGGGIIFAQSPVKSYGGSAIATLNLAGAGTLTSITGITRSTVTTLSTINWSQGTTACIAKFQCLDYTYHFYSRDFSSELNFSSDKFGIFSFTAGLFYFHRAAGSDASIQRNIVPGGIPGTYVDFVTRSYAAYGEADIQATDKLQIILGGRYTHEPHRDTITKPVVMTRTETFNSFVPRVSVKYDFTSHLNVYATYSKGEKSGLTGVANTASTPPFAKIDPEKLTSYEIGTKFASHGVVLNLSGFYYDYKNKQEQVFTGTTGFIQNTGPVRMYGLDADAVVRVGQDLTFRGGLTWVPEAKYRDFPDASGYDGSRTASGTFRQIVFNATGHRLLRSPEFTGNLGIDYTHKLTSGTVDAGANVTYSTSVFHDYNIVQPAYAQLDARLGYKLGDNGPRIGLYGRNLTNKAYIVGSYSSSGGFSAIYSRPREAGLSLSFAY